MTTPEDEEQKQRTLAVVHALCPAAKQVRVAGYGVRIMTAHDGLMI